MNEAMKDNTPLTPEIFVNTNLPVIKKVFPELVNHDPTISNAPTNSLEVPNLIANLENQVWNTMGNDPALQKLGREGYNALPEEQRLKLLEDTVHLLDAAQEADKFLNSK